MYSARLFVHSCNNFCKSKHIHFKLQLFTSYTILKIFRLNLVVLMQGFWRKDGDLDHSTKFSVKQKNIIN